LPAERTLKAPRAVLIAGPTASGKSTAALELARRLGGTIVNADSMQVYRELSILTARPGASEEAELPHRLFGIVSAVEAYSVGRWLKDAASAMREAWDAGRLPILAGGTGLYFKALAEGLAPVPDVPSEVRTYWRGEAEKLGPKALHAALRARDPALAARLAPTDPQRLVRALEVIDATGVSLAEWQGETAAPVLGAEAALKIVVAPEREPLYAAIDARFDRMIAQGALEEARALAQLGLDPGLPALRAHGVRELLSFLAGAISLEEAVAKAKTSSRRYAKRQMTWARRFMADWEWVADAAATIELADSRLATP
jgi:tRNA dimethylallyltransferase